MRVPPLELKVLLEPNPLKTRISVLVRRLAVSAVTTLCAKPSELVNNKEPEEQQIKHQRKEERTKPPALVQNKKKKKKHNDK